MQGTDNMNIVIATIKSWNLENALLFKEQHRNTHQVKIIKEKKELCLGVLNEFSPDYIFFPHWSYIIPKEIYESYSCVVFHMTDLPYGRGGSPLQNLIIRGFKQTKVSAIKVTRGLDTGPVFLKRDVSLEGSADEIYHRISELVFTELIPEIITNHIQPIEQTGEPVIFKRRSPDESELLETLNLEEIYDYIRMLDAEGYPKAFLRWGNYKFVFTDGQYDGNKITASVEIMEEGK